jgi:hypothetical protein
MIMTAPPLLSKTDTTSTENEAVPSDKRSFSRLHPRSILASLSRAKSNDDRRIYEGDCNDWELLPWLELLERGEHTAATCHDDETKKPTSYNNNNNNKGHKNRLQLMEDVILVT